VVSREAGGSFSLKKKGLKGIIPAMVKRSSGSSTERGAEGCTKCPLLSKNFKNLSRISSTFIFLISKVNILQHV
jgi:hypothetical protein